MPSVRDEDEHPADGGDATQIRTDTTQEPVSPPTIPRYTFTPVSILGAPEDFYLAPTSTIADVLLRVVNQEAPIHLTEATRRVATFWQMSRAGSRIRDRIERIAWTLNLQGEVELGGDFLWRKDQREIPIRSRAIPGYSFDTDYICPEEFDAAIIFALRTNGPRMKEELTTEVARLMGFERTGHKLSQQISAGVQRLVENGELRIVATGIQIIDARGG